MLVFSSNFIKVEDVLSSEFIADVIIICFFVPGSCHHCINSELLNLVHLDKDNDLVDLSFKFCHYWILFYCSIVREGFSRFFSLLT